MIDYFSDQTEKAHDDFFLNIMNITSRKCIDFLRFTILQKMYQIFSGKLLAMWDVIIFTIQKKRKKKKVQ